jgi:hypothetical protein
MKKYPLIFPADMGAIHYQERAVSKDADSPMYHGVAEDGPRSIGSHETQTFIRREGTSLSKSHQADSQT